MTLRICLRKSKNMKYFGCTSTTRSAIVGLLGNPIDARDVSGVDSTTTENENTQKDVERAKEKAGVANLTDT